MPKKNRGLRVIILCNSSKWGLAQDAKLIEQILRECNSLGHTKIDTITHMNPLQFYCGPTKPEYSDLIIHLEIPCRAAVAWAPQHIVVVNPEWWMDTSWDWAIEDKRFLFVFKTNYGRSLFPTLEGSRCRIISWRCSNDFHKVLGDIPKPSQVHEFLYLIGASKNKLRAAQIIVSTWSKKLPPLTIVGDSEILTQLGDIENKGIKCVTTLSLEERLKLQTKIGYHIVASTAEGFGFTMSEAAVCGAIPLWTNLPVYEELYGSILGNVGKIECKFGAKKEFKDTVDTSFSSESVLHAVKTILEMNSEEETRMRGALKHLASIQSKNFRTGWRNILNTIHHRNTDYIISIPPKPIADPPNVAVITLTYNRREWWANMAKNILESDYPRNKLTWVVVDDSDSMYRVDSEILKFQSIHTDICIKYVSLPKKLPIGEKRNRGCAAAGSDCSLFCMMDDDDHYPPSSIPLRVSWLQTLKVECVYCSTLPMYDIPRYISAINVPPLWLGCEERISEASLCFTRKFWEERKFPNPCSIAEGEPFLSGRIQSTIEIPPNGVIVSFIHKGNLTSRRTPEQKEPNGSYYGFDDTFFEYLCRTGGSQGQ